MEEPVTLEEWRRGNPERWARIEGTLTRNAHRTLKFLDAQIYLGREAHDGQMAPDSPEVKWLRSCIAIYLYVCANGLFPKTEPLASWSKNQWRGSLCDYQVAALLQIPGWQWRPRRTKWDERAADLDDFRREFGREPRVRSIWDYERALAHWNTRQKLAAREGKLTEHQCAVLEGDTGTPTLELDLRMPEFAGSFEAWFRNFWDGLAASVTTAERIGQFRANAAHQEG